MHSTESLSFSWFSLRTFSEGWGLLKTTAFYKEQYVKKFLSEYFFFFLDFCKKNSARSNLLCLVSQPYRHKNPINCLCGYIHFYCQSIVRALLAVNDGQTAIRGDIQSSHNNSTFGVRIETYFKNVIYKVIRCGEDSLLTLIECGRYNCTDS